MLEHLDINKIIDKNQFGFQKQKLCLNTIIALTEKINHYVEEKNIVLTIFLDLRKLLTQYPWTFSFKKLKNIVLEKTQESY